MSNNELKPLAGLLTSANSGLGQLADAARLRADLGDHLRKRLDRSLSPGLVHCNLRDDAMLVVTAASPEWAARLRFATAEILAISQERGLTIKSVKVRVGA